MDQGIVWTYLVYEPEVVGHEDESALKVVDGVGQGVDGLHVEVVGGLVEEQHVRRLPGQPREHHATPLPVRQLLNGARLKGGRTEEEVKEAFKIRLVSRRSPSIARGAQNRSAT